jgi:hypothetical protein
MGEWTAYMRKALDEMARDEGFVPDAEVVSIDVVWYAKESLHAYGSGNKTVYISKQPAEYLIELENYEGGNPGAALIRLLHARGKHRVLISRADDVPERVQAMGRLADELVTTGLLRSGDRVEIVVLQRDNGAHPEGWDTLVTP